VAEHIREHDQPEREHAQNELEDERNHARSIGRRRYRLKLA
jgi:hypothetical protein